MVASVWRMRREVVIDVLSVGNYDNYLTSWR